MTTECIHCRRPVRPEDGVAFYVGAPYYGVAHRNCLPFFAFNGNWPHSQPYQYYLNRR